MKRTTYSQIKYRYKKMQEMFNKDPKEIKKSQSIMKNAITGILNPLNRTNSRVTKAENRYVSWKTERWK